MLSESHLETAAREFARLKRLADGALAQVPSDRYFTVLSAGGNSVATVMKHLGGNMRSRWTEFLTTDGEKPWRDRDQEFEIGGGDSRETLHARWEEGWGTLFRALAELRPDDEERAVTIRGERMTVSQAIHRQLTHVAYHVGQLVFLAKHFAGSAWSTLSVPRGESKSFNAAPRKYLDAPNHTSST